MARQKKTTDLGPQVLTWPAVGDLVDCVTNGEREGFAIRNACDDSKSGHWYCVTHEQHFDNQFAKDSHIARGAHQLVWCCHLHGLEISLDWK